MPCSDGGPSYSDYDKQNKQIKSLTQMLCHVCTRADAGASWKTILSENLNLKRWWAEHQEEDKRRLQAEQRDAKIKKAKASALAKLTKEERTLLGFNGEEE